MQGALFTTPLPLSLLASSDRSCSICLEPYIEPPSGQSARKCQSGEWAVRIELVAEVSAQRRCCGHVIGKHCLEAHLRSPGPWKRRCPLCRDVWFREPSNASRASPQSHELWATPSAQRTTGSRTIAAERARHDRSRSPPRERGEQRFLCPGRPKDASNFTQKVRKRLEIEDGSEEIGKTLEEVEQTLREWYDRAEDLRG